jgi:hypothetical protein
MKKTTLILFSILILIDCKPNHEKEIVGKWLCISNCNDQTYEFKPDYNYVFRLNEFVTLAGRYKVVSQTDSLILYGEDNQVLFDFIYKIKDNHLFLLNYKGHHQIDEISLLKRENDTSLIENNKDNKGITTIILPEKFIGLVYLKYNKKVGENIVMDELGNPTIKIPFNGLQIVKLHEDPFNYVLGKFNFVERTRENVDKKLPFFFFTEYIGKLDRLLSKGYNMDSIYVCIYGYNQTPREELNKVFRQTIDGNVLMFNVDTLKNMIVNPFLKTDLRPEKK